MRPLIGIPPEKLTNRSQTTLPQYVLNTTYTDAIFKSGGQPILLPFGNDPAINLDLFARLQGVVLAGGEDIQFHNPSSRDAYEMQLAAWAIEHEVPLLGICRGMQMINVVQGGTLYGDIATERPDALNHLQSTLPKDQRNASAMITIHPESKLAKQLGTATIAVNEFHHQAVHTLGNSLIPTAWAQDGIIEALEGTGSGYIIGVQCHPESLAFRTETRWQRLFAAFVQQCDATTPQVNLRSLRHKILAP